MKRRRWRKSKETPPVGEARRSQLLTTYGAGSMIDLPNVALITGGTNYDARLFIQAANGGEVSLPSVRQISDPTGGDTRYRTIDVTVSRLRRKLESADPSAPALVTTVRNGGYLFAGDVKDV